MASFDQKLRTLYLMEILMERTDDEHMLNASELCTILDQEYGISTDRRTIYTEMEILDKFGLDIQQKKGKCPGYYIGARDFELLTSGTSVSGVCPTPSASQLPSCRTTSSGVA